MPRVTTPRFGAVACRCCKVRPQYQSHGHARLDVPAVVVARWWVFVVLGLCFAIESTLAYKRITGSYTTRVTVLRIGGAWACPTLV